MRALVRSLLPVMLLVTVAGCDSAAEPCAAGAACGVDAAALQDTAKAGGDVAVAPDPGAAVDAAPLDAGVDASPSDAAAPPDLGPADSGSMDSGPPEVATTDLGAADSGPPSDAGAPDPGPSDVGADPGPFDGGGADPGPLDAAADSLALDAGPVDAGPTDAAPVDVGAPDVGTDWPVLVPPSQVAAWVAASWPMTLVDVREPAELAGGKIPGALNLPWIGGALATDWGTLPTDLPVVVYCASGGRSAAASAFLVDQGLAPVYDMAGGFNSYKAGGFPIE